MCHHHRYNWCVTYLKHLALHCVETSRALFSYRFEYSISFCQPHASAALQSISHHSSHLTVLLYSELLLPHPPQAPVSTLLFSAAEKLTF